MSQIIQFDEHYDPTDSVSIISSMVNEIFTELPLINAPITVKLLEQILTKHNEGLLRVTAKMYRDDPDYWDSCIEVNVRFIAVMRSFFSQAGGEQ